MLWWPALELPWWTRRLGPLPQSSISSPFLSFTVSLWLWLPFSLSLSSYLLSLPADSHITMPEFIGPFLLSLASTLSFNLPCTGSFLHIVLVTLLPSLLLESAWGCFLTALPDFIQVAFHPMPCRLTHYFTNYCQLCFWKGERGMGLRTIWGLLFIGHLNHFTQQILRTPQKSFGLSLRVQFNYSLQSYFMQSWFMLILSRRQWVWVFTRSSLICPGPSVQLSSLSLSFSTHCFVLF